MALFLNLFTISLSIWELFLFEWTRVSLYLGENLPINRWVLCLKTFELKQKTLALVDSFFGDFFTNLMSFFVLKLAFLALFSSFLTISSPIWELFLFEWAQVNPYLGKVWFKFISIQTCLSLNLPLNWWVLFLKTFELNQEMLALSNSFFGGFIANLRSFWFWISVFWPFLIAFLQAHRWFENYFYLNELEAALIWVRFGLTRLK